MMKSKTVKLVSAAAVLVLLSGAYIGVSSMVESQEKKETEAADKSVDLVEIDPDKIISVSFTDDNGKMEGFKKEEDSWIKEDEKEFPVNQDSLGGAVNSLASLDADQELEEPSDLGEYNLDAPEREIILTEDDGSQTVLQIGMKNETTGQYYVKKSDEAEVYLVSGTMLEPFMGNAYGFAKVQKFPSVNSSEIKSIKIEKEQGYELSKDEQTLFWYIKDGKKSEKADTSKAEAAAAAIGTLSYGELVDYDCTDKAKYGLENPYAIISATYMAEEDTEANTGATEASEQVNNSSDKPEKADVEEEKSKKTEKTLVIYVGDEIEGSRYVKVNDSNEIYTIPEEALTEILDKEPSDLYSLTVNYLTVNNLESLELCDGEERHTVKVVRTAETISEDTEKTDDKDGNAENPEKKDTETQEKVTYILDGKEIEESLFTTFYNKLINMTGQKRLTEAFEPDAEAAYSFVFTDTKGNETTVDYYEYNSSFYAAKAGDKVYLVNKMNVKDMTDACEAMMNGKASSDQGSTENNAE